MKPEMSRPGLLLLLGAVLGGLLMPLQVGIAQADSPETNPARQWGLESLMESLAERPSGQSRFTEKKYLSVLDTPIEQSGTLAFAPGRLEKLTLHPGREHMIVDGSTLTIETGADRKLRRLQLHRYPVVWGFVEGLRASITGDLDTLQRFYEVELHGDHQDWELLMRPIRPDMSRVVRMLSVRGQDDRVVVIEVVQDNGDRSVMRIVESG